MTDQKTSVWPDRLRLRDTMLHDDRGGLGQRIYTTAGQGYTKVEYVRGDLLNARENRIEQLEAALRLISNPGDVTDAEELGYIAREALENRE